MTADHVLAIDVGTQSVRALVFDPRGNLVSRGRVPIVPYVSPRPGWAEQEPEVYWRAIGDACTALWASGAASREAIAAVALTTQRATIVATDAAGVPLRPAIVWLDQRRTEGLPAIGGVTGLAFRALGVRRTVAAFQADCEASWIRANEKAGLVADRPLPVPQRLARPPADGSVRRLGGGPGRLRPVRLQADALGEARRLALAGRAARSRLAARARAAAAPRWAS